MYCIIAHISSATSKDYSLSGKIYFAQTKTITPHTPLNSSLFVISSVLDYGGPDGEAGAAMRYLSQRYSMTDRRVMGALTDIGREAPEMFLSGANAFFDAFATV